MIRFVMTSGTSITVYSDFDRVVEDFNESFNQGRILILKHDIGKNCDIAINPDHVMFVEEVSEKESPAN